jgi:hypothetical protein
MNKPLLALLTTFMCVFGLQSARATQTEASADPPSQGEELSLLLGLRAEDPKVAALCVWAGAPAPDWQTEVVSGKGIKLTFVDSRLSKIYLEMERSGRGPTWPGELPMNLSRSTKKKDLTMFNNWKGEYTSEGDLSKSNYRTIEWTRSFGDHTMAGFEGEVLFSSSGSMRHVKVEVSSEWWWYQYSFSVGAFGRSLDRHHHT